MSKTTKKHTCHKQQNSASSLQYHIESVHEDSKYNCDLCSMEFSHQRILNNHIKNVHERKAKYNCSICDKEYLSQNGLTKHELSHIKHQMEKIHKCDKCEFKTHDKDSLRAHQKVHDTKRYACKDCNKEYKKKETLMWHWKKQHSDQDHKSFHCSSCEFKTHHRPNLTMHVNTVHLGLRPFKCELCEKSFTQKSHLRTHQKTVHDSSFSVQCPECLKQLKSQRSLTEHMIRVHSNVKRFHCKICGHGVNSRNELKSHSFVHQEDDTRPFHCESCLKGFISQPQLKIHLNTCKKLHSVSCELCNESFINEKYLKSHLEHHHEVQKCDKCSKEFEGKHKLNIHKKRNHSSTIHQCEFCEKTFKRTDECFEHELRVHSSLKRFKCEICGHGVNSKAELIRHSFIHKNIKDRPYECEHCKMRFVFDHDLKAHLKRTSCKELLK